MPISRPSQVGEPIGRVAPIPDYNDAETAQVDRKLQQLKSARQKRALVADERRWASIKLHLRLSPLQELLFQAVDIQTG